MEQIVGTFHFVLVEVDLPSLFILATPYSPLTSITETLRLSKDTLISHLFKYFSFFRLYLLPEIVFDVNPSPRPGIFPNKLLD